MRVGQIIMRVGQQTMRADKLKTGFQCVLLLPSRNGVYSEFQKYYGMGEGVETVTCCNTVVGVRVYNIQTDTIVLNPIIHPKLRVARVTSTL